jgi:hypothetical protein
MIKKKNTLRFKKNRIRKPVRQKKDYKIIYILFFILIISILVLGYLFSFLSYQKSQIQTYKTTSQSIKPTYENWKTYKSMRNNFEIKYPSEIKPYENNDPNDKDIDTIRFIYIGNQPYTKEYVEEDGYDLLITTYKGEKVKYGTNYGEKGACYHEFQQCYKSELIINKIPVKTAVMERETSEYKETIIYAGLPYKDKFFDFWIKYAGKELNIEKYKSTLDKMIATFKFVD